MSQSTHIPNPAGGNTSPYEPFSDARVKEIAEEAERWIGRTGNGFSPFTVLRLIATIEQAKADHPGRSQGSAKLDQTRHG